MITAEDRVFTYIKSCSCVSISCYLLSVNLKSNIKVQNNSISSKIQDYAIVTDKL
jgi:ethanolamine utilization protein EutQ (cupin superfamily)